ncbi:hypothetical protein BKA82DRAFT_4020205 [Pisolithus tinctorius]|nr:hypothetical protein BKA82DRAFT_4020205 [Pisolithus tinctorius]
MTLHNFGWAVYRWWVNGECSGSHGICWSKDGKAEREAPEPEQHEDGKQRQCVGGVNFTLIIAVRLRVPTHYMVVEPRRSMPHIFNTERSPTVAGDAIDDRLVKENEACFEQPVWVEMLEGDGFLCPTSYFAPCYQHRCNDALSNLPHSCSSREEARIDLLKWICKWWMVVHQEGGSDALEGWSIKETLQGRDGNLASPGALICSVARSMAVLTPSGSAGVLNHSTTSH